jgi:hypothetical protein
MKLFQILIFYLLIAFSLQVCEFDRRKLKINQFRETYISLGDEIYSHQDISKDKFSVFTPTLFPSDIPGFKNLKCQKHCSVKNQCLIECLGGDFRVWHYHYSSGECSEGQLKNFYLQPEGFKIITNIYINNLSIDVDMIDNEILNYNLNTGKFKLKVKDQEEDCEVEIEMNKIMSDEDSTVDVSYEFTVKPLDKKKRMLIYRPPLKSNFFNALYLIYATYKETECNNGTFLYSSVNIVDDSFEHYKALPREFLISTRKESFLYLSTGVMLDITKQPATERYFDRFVKLTFFGERVNKFFFFNFNSRKCADFLIKYVEAQIADKDLSHNIIVRFKDEAGNISKYKFDSKDMMLIQYGSDDNTILRKSKLVNLRIKDIWTISVVGDDLEVFYLKKTTDLDLKTHFEVFLSKTCLMDVDGSFFNYCVLDDPFSETKKLTKYVNVPGNVKENAKVINLSDFYRFEMKKEQGDGFDNYIYHIKSENDSLMGIIQFQTDITAMLSESICQANDREFYFRKAFGNESFGKLILEKDNSVIIEYFSKDRESNEYEIKDVFIYQDAVTNETQIKLLLYSVIWKSDLKLFTNNYSDKCLQSFEKVIKNVSHCQGGYKYTHVENLKLKLDDLTEGYDEPVNQKKEYIGKVEKSIINDLPNDNNYVLRKFIEHPEVPKKFLVELISPLYTTSDKGDKLYPVTRIWFNYQNFISDCDSFSSFVENQPNPVGENEIYFYSHNIENTNLSQNGKLKFNANKRIMMLTTEDNTEIQYKYDSLIFQPQPNGIYSELILSLTEKTLESKPPKAKVKGGFTIQKPSKEIIEADRRMESIKFGIFFTPLTSKSLWMILNINHSGDSCSNGFVAYKTIGTERKKGLLYVSPQGLIKRLEDGKLTDYSASELSAFDKSYKLTMYDREVKNKIELNFDFMNLEINDKIECFNKLNKLIVDSKSCSPAGFYYKEEDKEYNTNKFLFNNRIKVRISPKEVLEYTNIIYNRPKSMVVVYCKRFVFPKIFTLSLGNYICKAYFEKQFRALRRYNNARD